MEGFLPGWSNPADDPWEKKILAALAAEGRPAVTYTSGCGTNATGAAAVSIPAYIYGPGNLAQAHMVDERVSIEGVHRAVRGFRAIAAGCLAS